MNTDLVARLFKSFESIARTEEGVEFWLARELKDLLGYSKWNNFGLVLQKARLSCDNAGLRAEDHFTDVGKMVDLGSGAQRRIEDLALTRYACYLIAQNGGPRKPEIAFAQTYFAVQTRKQELVEQRLAEHERL